MEARQAAQVATKYVADRSRTARSFDLRSGMWDSISIETIASTRVFSSRISSDQCEWFVQRARTAPWSNVGVDDRLADADPFELNGLFDRALVLWSHFFEDRGTGITTAKISKVLHAMRPAFFPVLDSRILRSFRSEARAEAKKTEYIRPGTHAYWAALRTDILKKQSLLDDTRSLLTQDESKLVREWGQHISDVRLHDVLWWTRG